MLGAVKARLCLIPNMLVSRTLWAMIKSLNYFQPGYYNSEEDGNEEDKNDSDNS